MKGFICLFKTRNEKREGKGRLLFVFDFHATVFAKVLAVFVLEGF